jgi:hypothetical protein
MVAKSSFEMMESTYQATFCRNPEDHGGAHVLLSVAVLKVSYFVWMWNLAPKVKERERTGVWYKVIRKIFWPMTEETRGYCTVKKYKIQNLLPESPEQ